MVAGLFSGYEADGRGYLYVTAKGENHWEDGTPWWLLKLDPENGRELARLRLPEELSAAHVTVIPPQEDFWKIVERDAVIAIKSGIELAPYMKTDMMTLVPSSWLTETVDSAGHCEKLALLR